MLTESRSRVEQLLSAAQETVDKWRRDPKRGPFCRVVNDAEHLLRGWLIENDEQALAFRKVANAIRVGYGHAIANPCPLRELLREAMRGSPSPLSEMRAERATGMSLR
jgi:hypothetical protein